MDEFQIWYTKKQRRYNCILAMTSLIIACVGVLQIIKIYELTPPEFIYWILCILIIIALILTIFEVWDEFTG